jgi:hypothetical protein
MPRRNSQSISFKTYIIKITYDNRSMKKKNIERNQGGPTSKGFMLLKLYLSTLKNS